MSLVVERLGLIIAQLTHVAAGHNINGPCCIEMPEWCVSRLGRFYLYFSDHVGSHIKLAYANNIVGPWTIYEGGVLGLSDYKDAYDHIASPDIIIDEERRQLRLYFHARSRSRGREQWTFAASSEDGLNFRPAADYPLAPFYLKLFRWHGFFYGISKGGNLWRSKDGLTPFNMGGNPFNRSMSEDLWCNEFGSIRHVGLSLYSDILTVYFTRIGDAPERILRSRINLSVGDWCDWVASVPEEVLQPAEDYEGAHLQSRSSVSGPSHLPENGVRDPHILSYLGKEYMFYSVAGEQGIAVCRLHE